MNWGKESIEQAIKAVTDNVVSVLETAQLFHVSYTSFYRKVESKQKQIFGENEISSTSIARSAVLSSVLEKNFSRKS